MTGEAFLGDVAVQVKADLNPLKLGFAQAERQSKAWAAKTSTASRAASTAFASLTRESRSLSQAIRSIDGPLGGVASRLTAATALARGTGPVLAGMALGIGAVTVATKGWFNATIEAEDTLVALRQALRATGREAELSAPRMAAFSSELQKSTAFEDEAITRLQTRLVTFTNISRDLFPRATRATLDYAQATGKDLTSAVLQLGVALQNPAEALQRLNRTERIFTNAQADLIEQLARTGKLAEAQEMILAGLEARYKGAAEAARNTLGGAVRALGNSIQDLTELSGGPLQGLTKAFNFLNDNLTETVQIIKTAGVIGGTVLVARFFGPMTQATLEAAAAQVTLQRAVMSGNAVIIGSARALEQKAAAEAESAAAALEAAQAETAYAAAEAKSLALDREMVVAEIALADERLKSVNAMRAAIPGIGGGQKAAELAEIATLQRQNAALASLQSEAEVELSIATSKEAAAAAIATQAQAAHAEALERASLAARVATGATTALRSVMAFFGGPVGLAITAAALGFYLLSRNSEKADDSIDDFTGSMDRLNAVLDTTEQHMQRIALEEKDRAIQLASTTLETEKAKRATQELLIEQLESAALSRQGKAAPGPVTKERNRLIAEAREELKKLNEQIVQLETGLTKLKAQPEKPIAPPPGSLVDPEILKRRRETIDDLKAETGTLSKLTPLYKAHKITIDDLNTSVNAEQTLAKLLLTTQDAEGKQIAELIAKRAALQKQIDVTTTTQDLELQSRTFEKLVPLYKSGTITLEDFNAAQDAAHTIAGLRIDDASDEAKAITDLITRISAWNKELRAATEIRDTREDVRDLKELLPLFDARALSEHELNTALESRSRLRKLELDANSTEGKQLADLIKEYDELNRQKEISSTLRNLRAETNDLKELLPLFAQQSTIAHDINLALETRARLRSLELDANSKEGQEIAEQIKLYDQLNATKDTIGDLKNLHLETEALERQAKTLSMTAEQAAVYQKVHELINAALERGTELTPELIAQINQEAAAYGGAVKVLEDTQRAHDLAGTAAHTLADAISEIGVEGRKAEDILNDIVKAIERAVIQAALLGEGPFGGLFGKAASGGQVGGILGGLGGILNLGSLFGGGAAAIADAGGLAFQATEALGFPGVFHKGGIVGEDRVPTRAISASVFKNAQRFHSGLPKLRAGEIPAIVEEGEEITPKEVVKRRRSRSGMLGVTINNYGVPYTDDFERTLTQSASRAAGQFAVASRRQR